MRVLRRVHHMVRLAQKVRLAGQTIGLVPTMGALHEGHLSLIRAARRENDVVVVSVFVNPRQFGPTEDFARYPRDLRRDLRLASSEGTDVVFAPEASEMYPKGFCTSVEVEGLSSRLEGAMRPGHFRGVTTVVAMLFHAVQPTRAYFGQKDYQQAVIIRRMVEDLRLLVRVRVLPTIREPDGLAMSSRNAYLSRVERREAGVLFRALTSAEDAIHDGERDPQRLRRRISRLIQQQPRVRAQEIAIVDAGTLEPVKTLTGRVAMLVSARVGRMRLIDNLLVDVT